MRSGDIGWNIIGVFFIDGWRYGYKEMMSVLLKDLIGNCLVFCINKDVNFLFCVIFGLGGWFFEVCLGILFVLKFSLGMDYFVGLGLMVMYVRVVFV